MSRLFWVGIGFAAGVVLTRKVNAITRQATPAGIAENIGLAIRDLAGSLGAFGAEVRAGMAEREHELADVVYLNTPSTTDRTWVPRHARAPRADG